MEEFKKEGFWKLKLDSLEHMNASRLMQIQEEKRVKRREYMRKYRKRGKG